MTTVNWDNPEDPVVKLFVGFDVEGYVEEYELCSDGGDYTPNEQERTLLVDAIYGVVSNLHEELRKIIQASKPSHQNALEDADEAYANVQASPGIEWLTSEQQHMRGLDAAISAYLSALAPQAGDNAEEPVAWVIPGSDNARADGFIDAMAWQEGEFSRPLYAHPCTSTPVLSQNAPALEDKG
jgi:hypothetical protein